MCSVLDACLRPPENRKTLMKLAEALILRADLQKRTAQLSSRLKDSARVQEGDEPAENVDDLMIELNECLARLEQLIYQINVTNLQTLHQGENLTRRMARRDVLTQRIGVMRDLVAHVTENSNRYGRNEIKTVRLVDVARLRRDIDDYSRQLRELDTEIQSLNWTVDLVES